MSDGVSWRRIGFETRRVWDVGGVGDVEDLAAYVRRAAELKLEMLKSGRFYRCQPQMWSRLMEVSLRLTCGLRVARGRGQGYVLCRIPNSAPAPGPAPSLID